MRENIICKNWYEENYERDGFRAQRLYPNEELCRFLGRNYLNKIDKKERNYYKALEVGCGSCANLWMIAKEGFDSYGCDLSEEAIKLGKEMLAHWNVSAELSVQDMTNLQYDDNYFDVVVDVFSSYCLNEIQYERFITHVKRVLKEGGRFFSYTPSKNSGAFKNYFPAKKMDESTLDGIKRGSSPFYGNNYPFRFMSQEEVKKNFTWGQLEYIEIVSKSYYGGQEQFEWLAIEVIK